MIRHYLVLVAVFLVLATACSDDNSSSTPVGEDVADLGGSDSGADTSDEEADLIPQCGTAGASIPVGLVELFWDNKDPAFTLDQASWTVDEQPLSEASLWEAVRFELAHPARVYGFDVMWGQLPDEGEEFEVSAGVFPDFGHNGFDFWQFEPLWEGTRCLGELEEEDWTTYALETPLEFDQPTLLYVAHFREGSGDTGIAMDSDVQGEGDCEEWDSCHSGVNIPELSDYFNGRSVRLPNDFMIRLFVEYLDEIEPEDTLFQPVSDVQPVHRMAWGDYNNDGWDDLFTTNVLYRNDGGTFTDVTADSGIAAAQTGSSGGVWGDYDNDGFLDLFVFAESYTTGDSLLRNLGDGTFENVTETSLITDVQDYNNCGDSAYIDTPTPAAAWIDIDSDGLLDIYLANFICWDEWTFYVDGVWHNEGDGTFVEWTGDNGFSDQAYSGRGANPIDYDQDGDVDLLVNNYTLHANLFYENVDSWMVEQAQTNGLSGVSDFWDGRNYFGHTIGAAWGDLDNDGDFDCVLANLAHPRYFHFSDKTQIFINNGEGRFDDIQGDWEYPSGDAGLLYQETHSVPVLADFDNDGVLDLSISATYSGRPTDFYWGNGDGTFTLDSYNAGITVEDGWGTSASDFDNDGDVDLSARGVLFENTMAAGDSGHWLQVRAIGNVDSNWAALGATITVTAGTDSQIRHVNGGTGQGCQDSLYVHFGLGDAISVDQIEVLFPGGGSVTYTGPFDADQRIWLYEDGQSHEGWGPAD